MFRTTIVYESMFGATRTLAEAIARGLAESDGAAEVRLRRVGEVSAEDVVEADLLIVGAPTHAHSMSRPQTRTEAAQWSRSPEKELTLEPGALDPGIREFLRDLPGTRAGFVAFDTHAAGPDLFTGSAANGIAKRLRRAGLVPLLPPQTFAVDGRSRLVEGEEARAASLGRSLVEQDRQAATPS